MEAKRRQGQEVNDGSVLHSLDLALRKRTAALIAACRHVSGQAKAAMGQRCSAARKQCLADCRNRLSGPTVCTSQVQDMDAFLWEHIAAFDQCTAASQ